MKGRRFSFNVLIMSPLYLLPQMTPKDREYCLKNNPGPWLKFLLLLSFLTIFCGLYFSASQGLRKTHTWRGSLVFSTEHSPNQIICGHCAGVSYKLSLDNLKRSLTYLVVWRGRSAALYFFISFSRRRREMVRKLILEFNSHFNAHDAILVLDRALRTTNRSSCLEGFVDPGPSNVVWRIPFFSTAKCNW